MKIRQFRNIVQELEDKINNSNLDEFIAWAKEYNIYQEGGTKFYKSMCDKIKERLDKENLDYDVVRPD